MAVCPTCGHISPELQVIEDQVYLRGRLLRIQPKPRAMLLLMLRRLGRPCYTHSLVAAMWPAQDEPEDCMNVIRANITYLRQALRMLELPLEVISHGGGAWLLAPLPTERQLRDALDLRRIRRGAKT